MGEAIYLYTHIDIKMPCSLAKCGISCCLPWQLLSIFQHGDTLWKSLEWVGGVTSVLEEYKV